MLTLIHAEEYTLKCISIYHIWDIVLRNGLGKSCGRQPLKNMERYGLLFKSCLPQILLGPFLNTLSYIKCKHIVSSELNGMPYFRIKSEKNCRKHGKNISSNWRINQLKWKTLKMKYMILLRNVKQFSGRMKGIPIDKDLPKICN